MMIDNFDEIKKHMTFETQFDRYMLHIIKRAKDSNGKDYGVNENQRMIMTKAIPSIEYLDRKIPMFKDMCERNNARAYILPQVRHNEECLKQMLKLIVDNLDNPTISPAHLIRSAYCGYHGSRDKKWILDLDEDNLVEYNSQLGFPRDFITKKEWTYDEIFDFVKKQLVECGKSEDCAYMIPTKSGKCIVTSPFDLKKAHERCNMFYEGQHRTLTGYKSVGPGEYEAINKDINGWLIKDGMCLAYYNPDSKV